MYTSIWHVFAWRDLLFAEISDASARFEMLVATHWQSLGVLLKAHAQGVEEYVACLWDACGNHLSAFALRIELSTGLAWRFAGTVRMRLSFLMAHLAIFFWNLLGSAWATMGLFAEMLAVSVWLCAGIVRTTSAQCVEKFVAALWRTSGFALECAATLARSTASCVWHKSTFIVYTVAFAIVLHLCLQTVLCFLYGDATPLLTRSLQCLQWCVHGFWYKAGEARLGLSLCIEVSSSWLLDRAGRFHDGILQTCAWVATQLVTGASSTHQALQFSMHFAGIYGFIALFNFLHALTYCTQCTMHFFLSPLLIMQEGLGARLEFAIIQLWQNTGAVIATMVWCTESVSKSAWQGLLSGIKILEQHHSYVAACAVAVALYSVVFYPVTSMSSHWSVELCVVCMHHPKSYAFMPCGHFCVCEGCRSTLVRCPLCKGPARTVRIYR